MHHAQGGGIFAGHYSAYNLNYGGVPSLATYIESTSTMIITSYENYTINWKLNLLQESAA